MLVLKMVAIIAVPYNILRQMSRKQEKVHPVSTLKLDGIS